MKKKIFFIIVLFLFNINIVNAEEKIRVTINKCVDGDTAWFNLNNKKIKVRFLAIDTPESTNKIEEYGKSASKFTCDKLNSSKKIEIEYDKNSNKTDKYDRHLVWVFVDNKLLQNELIKEGLAEVKYLYGDYKYTEELESTEKKAKQNKVGIWSNNKETILTKENILILISSIIIIISYFVSKKTRNTINKKIIKKANKTIKNKIDDLI